MNRELEKLILLEARLLDAGNLDDWLKLYSERATYWIPMDEKADPLKDSSIVYDTYDRLKMRAHQIAHEGRVAQSPPSEIMRMITNVDTEAEETASQGGMATARWNLLLIETRSGDWRQRGLGDVRMFPARCEAGFERAGESWRFVQKKIVLLNRTHPLEGLSFII